MAQMVKNLPAMQEPLVPTLSPEDSLGKGIATHSSQNIDNVKFSFMKHSLSAR